MTRITHIDIGTVVAISINFIGFCFSAILAASVRSNSLLSSLVSLHPYELKADTRKAYLCLSSKPSIIQDVSATNFLKCQVNKNAHSVTCSVVKSFPFGILDLYRWRCIEPRLCPIGASFVSI